MATTVLGENVLVLGGKDNKGIALNTVILYNLITKKCSKPPNMMTKRCGCTAVTIGDDIIVMGGWDKAGKKLNSVECYNSKNGWTKLQDMTEARALATAVVMHVNKESCNVDKKS